MSICTLPSWINPSTKGVPLKASTLTRPVAFAPITAGTTNCDMLS